MVMSNLDFLYERASLHIYWSLLLQVQEKPTQSENEIQKRLGYSENANTSITSSTSLILKHVKVKKIVQCHPLWCDRGNILCRNQVFFNLDNERESNCFLWMLLLYFAIIIEYLRIWQFECMMISFAFWFIHYNNI